MANLTQSRVAFIVGKGKQRCSDIYFEYMAKYGHIRRRTLINILYRLEENKVIRRVKRGIYM
jgi:hypothetical protein